MAKKIQIQVSSKKTSSAKYHSISLWAIAGWLILGGAALAGVVLFDPADLSKRLFGNYRASLSTENENLEETIQKVYGKIRKSETSLKDARKVKATVSNMASLEEPVAPKTNLRDPDKITLGENLERIRNSHQSFRKFLEQLQDDPEQARSLPLIHPIKNHERISARFEKIKDRFTGQILPHYGIDYVSYDGDTVLAPGDGIVESVSNHRGFGLNLTIRHNDRIDTYYAHLNRALVSAGTKVRRGEPIALLGSSGRSSGPHLHYEVRVFDTPVNPEDFFLTR